MRLSLQKLELHGDSDLQDLMAEQLAESEKFLSSKTDPIAEKVREMRDQRLKGFWKMIAPK